MCSLSLRSVLSHLAILPLVCVSCLSSELRLEGSILLFLISLMPLRPLMAPALARCSARYPARALALALVAGAAARAESVLFQTENLFINSEIVLKRTLVV